MTNDASPALPPHIEATVAAIAKLHLDHQKRATPLQAFIADLTARVGRPAFVAWLTLIIGAWIAINTTIHLTGNLPFDEPPFAWLELAASLAALYVTVMILSTQRRDDEIATHREQLTLELAVLGDQKSAKIIQLLEELRRDSSAVHDRADHEAAEMSSSVDPHTVLKAIQNSHEGMVEEGVDVTR